MDINKYRRIVEFHIRHYQDQNLSGDVAHMYACYFLLIGNFIKYADYARYCVNNDIAGISEQGWNKEMEFA